MTLEMTVLRIVEDAIHAPSGDNAQPWRFSFSGDTLTVRNVRGRDATLYNFRERGSFLAHGALAENIAISAQEAGLHADIRPFPGGLDETASITFAGKVAKKDPLYAFIKERSSNRKPYRVDSIDARHLESLQTEASRTPRASLRFVEDREGIRRLSEAVSLNEHLIMENRELHDFLFSIILWNESDEAMRPGLYIQTMEFPAPVRFLMRHVLRHWGAVRVFNRIGLSRAIPKESRAVYESSGSIGALVIEGKRDVDFFSAGRALQRVWLAATRCGLRMQPITAIPYLYQRVAEGEPKSLSDEHARLISDAHAVIARAFKLSEREHVAMLFRIGYGPEPTATSKRLPPVFE